MPKKVVHSKKRPRRTDKPTTVKKDKIEKAVIADVEKQVGKLARTEILARARDSKLAKLEERYRLKGMMEEADLVNAIKEVDGYISLVAEKIGVPASEVKEFVNKSKKLQNLIGEIKEAQIEQVEKTLYDTIIDKKNPLLLMFYLKCQGQQRGWIDRPTKAGGSENKPIYIKIMPVGGTNTLPPGEKNKGGRPRKNYAEIKIMPSSNVLPSAEEDNDVMDAEYTN